MASCLNLSCHHGLVHGEPEEAELSARLRDRTVEAHLEEFARSLLPNKKLIRIRLVMKAAKSIRATTFSPERIPSWFYY